ncbi:hypothetical protein Tco_0991235 [Tanacetum coccineum]|uniref:Uncharacterized protein n=1 Tax=Tanacetum coccineum TaxID=301880 RepID=A0ABQ5EYP2_9ASTR
MEENLNSAITRMKDWRDIEENVLILVEFSFLIPDSLYVHLSLIGNFLLLLLLVQALHSKYDIYRILRSRYSRISSHFSCGIAEASCSVAGSEIANGKNFLPWGTSSVCEEGFGALESTSTSRLQMAFMWSVKGGSSGKKGFGLSGLSRVTSSSLGVISGDEVFCDDDSAILSGEGFQETSRELNVRTARVWWVGSCGGDAGNDSEAFGKTVSRTKSGLLELVPHVRPLSKNWHGH